MTAGLTLLIEATGWIGAGLILGSYILVSLGRLEGRSRTLPWLNVAGAGTRVAESSARRVSTGAAAPLLDTSGLLT